MNTSDRIWIAGHRGLVGSAIVRKLTGLGYQNIVEAPREFFDLRDPVAVDLFFRKYQPEYVFLAAAKVGGIGANMAMPSSFLYDNLMIQNNVIDACRQFGIKKLLFLGSSCIYPKDAEQPIKEESLLTGPFESTNEAYALAKVSGIRMCQAYARDYGLNAICVMPCNLYGPNDNFDLEIGHVIPALIRKFSEAGDDVVVWGTGTPRREFMFVDDLADACHFLMQNYDSPEIINVGMDQDLTIEGLARMVKDITGSNSTIVFDASKPDGVQSKLVDSSKIKSMGWSPKIGLIKGLRMTFEWYKANCK